MLMFVFFCVIIYFEITNLIKGKKQKEKKYFTNFYAMFFGFVISALAYSIYVGTDLYTFDSSGWNSLYPLFMTAIMFGINCIILVISFFPLNKKNYKKNSNLSDFFKHFFLVIGIGILLVLGQFIFQNNRKNKIDSEIANETVLYLKNKYGTDEFKIIEIEREFAANGFIETDYLTNYEVEVIYLPQNIEFDIYLDVDDKRNIMKESSYDDFMSEYMKEYRYEHIDLEEEKNDFQKFLNTKGLNIEISVDDYLYTAKERAIPEKYGKIPTKEEYEELLVLYQLKTETKLTIKDGTLPGINPDEELKNYLLKATDYIIEYFGDDYGYRMSYACDFERGTVEFDKDKIVYGGYNEKIEVNR